jgi:sulfite reductase (NADPH) flavoprotein alpha-component
MSESRWGNSLPAEIVPENAPFDEEQRAWLNGFLAGLLGLANGSDSGAGAEPGAPSLGTAAGLAAGTAAAASVVGQATAGGATSPAASAAAAGAHALAAARELPQRQSRADAPSSGVPARRVLRTPVADEPASATVLRPRPVATEPGGVYSGSVQRLRVKSHRKLTLADAGSEIRELVLEGTDTPLDYRAGDCLAVLPHNDPDLVRALLRAVGARGQELVGTPSGPVEVWRCLLEHVDITHVREQTLRLFADEAGRAADVGVLGDALSPSSPSGFDLLDLLSLFPDARARPSLESIIATLGPLEPRLYAIASAPALYPGELHLAVRVVRAERGGRERRGVASHFLSEGVFRGDDVAARIHPAARFALPPERTGPVIMVASGTGLARFRAILQELDARGRRGNTWLIMASCSEGDEALYEPELRAWSRSGVLEHVDVVKLGQRGRRVGPEDVVRKRARRIASWFSRGALVYLCGEGKGLSSALSDTLVDVLGRQGKMSRAEAADLLHVMRRDGRYVEEVY